MFARRRYNKLRTAVPVLPPPPPPERSVKPLRDRKLLRKRLYKLDRSSTQFPKQLNELLQDDKWIEGLESLPEDELVEQIGYLDNILDSLDHTGLSFKEGLHVLCKICSSRAILPATYEVSDELLLGKERVALGGLGHIRKGSLGGADVCIRQLWAYMDGDEVSNYLCRVAVMWKHLNHPNIVPFRGVTFGFPQLVSEWIPGGDLREHLKINRHADLIGLLLGVAEGLGYLHSCNVIHGDLTVRNVLVDILGRSRITDFGHGTRIARSVNSFKRADDGQGHTIQWSAPEIWRVSAATKASDIFSFGSIIIEAFTGEAPFGRFSETRALDHIMDGGRPGRPDHPDFPESLWKLTRRCWSLEPQNRPNVQEVIEVLKKLHADRIVLVASANVSVAYLTLF